MHETGIVNSLIRKIEQIAREKNSEQVSRVMVQLGALTNISPAHFRYHFEIASRGTVAASASLEIDESEEIDKYAQDILLKEVCVEE